MRGMLAGWIRARVLRRFKSDVEIVEMRMMRERKTETELIC